ncbi:MAG: DUF3108 domain-containing protein [Cytophagales bacterium]|nr:MAG: DUF3108 domain-containing protein [Cytophagales bacterium]
MSFVKHSENKKMNKIIVTLILVSFISLAFTSDKPQTQVPFPYGTNEYIAYRVHYGFINAGEAKMQIDDKLYLINNKICHKAFVMGATSGPFDMAMRIRDSWATYLDTASRTPQRAIRDIAENKYRLREYTNYDYANNQLTIEREGSEKPAVCYKVPNDVQDIVSGFFYLRNIDFNKKRIGDTISMNAFLDNKLYLFKVRFTAREKIDSKFGEINCIKLNPIMEKNGLFEDGNSISFWISDDLNKIPIRIEAKMWLGKVAMDIKAYKNLKNPIHFED